MKTRILSSAFLLSLTVWGQSGSGTIAGSVRDATEAPVPNAAVSVLNQDTGVRLSTITNEAGLYRFGALVPGAYKIEVAAEGFDRLNLEGAVLQVSQTIAIDLVLQVGQRSETVSVTEQAPLVESQTSNVNQTINRQMLAGLPLPNRAASSLVLLAPGVVMVDNGAGTAENYPVFSVAGGRVRNQSFILDGANVTNAAGLTRPQQLVTLPVDAMQEFTVITNNYAAEYGHSTGGIVSMSTRAGTNQYHGSIFESLRNNALDARNFFAARRPPICLNQFGGTFGGPIRKNKTHFFLTWERTIQLASDTVASTVPTLANRAGDFADLRGASGQPVIIYDPSTTAGRARQPFPGNRIPVEQQDPVALAALNYYPLPNRAGTNTNSNNYVGNSANRLNRDIVMGRLDHQFSSKDLLTGRYYINDSATNDSGTYGLPAADPLSNITDVRVESALGGYTHIFGPALTNDVKFTYLRRKFINTRDGNEKDLAGQIGLRGVSNIALPAVGGEFRAAANNEIRGRTASGSLTMTPLITSQLAATGTVAGTGNALASLLLGEVNSANVQLTDLIRTRASYLGLYVQDDWRATDRLTLNFGLRWETELPRREVDNKLISFDPLAINPVSGTPGSVLFAGRNGTPERSFATDTNNFGPRFGFAWRIPGRGETVIRGGGGIFYASTVQNTVGDVASLGFSDSRTFVVDQGETQSAFRLRDGVPLVPRPALTAGIGAVALGQRPTTSIDFFNPKQVAPISYQYNLSVQREVFGNTVFEAGYLANVSHHLAANDFTLNQVRPESMGAGTAQLRRPFPQYSNVNWINPTIGNSTYHGGFVKAERRFSRGASFLAHYTFSKFLDDVAAQEEYGDPGSYMDAYNRRLDKGLSGSDVPHRLLVTVQYELPKLRINRFVNGVLGGWKAGLLETAQSGAGFTVVNVSNTTNGFPAGPLRPNLLRDAALAPDQRSITRWFDTSAFAAPAQFTFGNSPRSGLRGASQLTTDVTVEKSFHITEQFRFDLRGEFYNVLNKSNFRAPGHILGGPGFGVVSSAEASRRVQLAARLSF
ncbi:MAG: carboxypeptidase regulatory-like domain-containing protein [Acidobacteria bacterium]|nr:carboxypeptidase regulatory-like domain-containing protein [Acidobacteriota bacterium]